MTRVSLEVLQSSEIFGGFFLDAENLLKITFTPEVLGEWDCNLIIRNRPGINSELSIGMEVGNFGDG